MRKLGLWLLILTVVAGCGKNVVPSPFSVEPKGEVKKGEVKKGEVKKEEVKKEEVKKEEVKKGEVKKGEVKKEEVKKGEVKKEEVKKEEVKKEEVKKEEVKKEEVKTLLPKELFGISPTKLGIGLVVTITAVGAVTYGIHSCRSNTNPSGGSSAGQNPPSSPDAN